MPYPHKTETSLGAIVQSIRELWEGRSNAVGSFTLAVAPATTTTVNALNCGERSVPLLTPTTANAGAAIAAGNVYVSAVTNGSFVVTHPSSAQTDRAFSYAIAG